MKSNPYIKVGVLFLGALLSTAGHTPAQAQTHTVSLDTDASPVAVSPGSATGSLIGDACPTFSWGAVPQAKAYDLVVYRVEKGSEGATPVLRQRISGSALSWTPSLDSCLLRGVQYAWSTRAVGQNNVSEWSPLKIFQVASGPSEAEFERAVALVRQYLDGDSERGIETAEGSESLTATDVGPSAEAPVALAPATTQLAVDGNIDAVSFTGDGENLANVATDVELALHAGAQDAHHAPTVDTFVTNKDAHDHLDGDGASVLHSSLGSVGASDHHAPFSSADGPCFNTTQRFVDCGNGTVTDTVTGLIYLQDANCFGTRNWPLANQDAASLADGFCGLTDGSRAGDWRLQTKEEWEGILDSSCNADPEIVGNESPTPGCYSDNPWASGLEEGASRWSSTTNADNTDNAWFGNLETGNVGEGGKYFTSRVWPVRGGQSELAEPTTLGTTIDDTELTAEDFGSFSCTGGENGCVLDSDSVDSSELASTAIQAGDIEASDLPADGYASTYVNSSGDSMTGSYVLSDSSSTPALTVNQTGSGHIARFQDNGVDKFTVDGQGDVGIGVSSASTALDVREESASRNVVSFERLVGSVAAADMLQIRAHEDAADGTQFIEAERGVDVEFRVNGNGDVTADGTFSGPADFAEMIRVYEDAKQVEAGDVMVIDVESPRAVRRSSAPGSTLVAGIVSTTPGFLGSEHDWDQLALSLLGADSEAPGEAGAMATVELGRLIDEIPLAIVGIVPCKVSAEGGAIRPGDLLVTSSILGHAMRQDDPRNGAIVGKALGALEKGTGVIKVLVTLQ